MRIDELQRRILRCRACEALFRGRFVDPMDKREPLAARPVVLRAERAPVMLVGQAPGIEEYRSRRPFRGRAGAAIREVFERFGVAASDFDEAVYQTTVTKCFPGRRLVGRSGRLQERDRTPTGAEVRNCAPFLREQVRLVRPRVLVLLGAEAIAAYETLRGRRYGGGLRAYVGRAERWDGMAVIFLPHTSGTSRWLNQGEVRNRRLSAKAERLLGAELRRAGVVRGSLGAPRSRQQKHLI